MIANIMASNFEIGFRASEHSSPVHYDAIDPRAAMS